tara:strand:+ start:329 stop:904 length:576 start_codon:yes stop_codon:yes gene_type:complete
MKSLDSVLIILDIQERLIANIIDQETIVWNSKRLIEAANLLGITVIYTEQNPNKLGLTLEVLRNKCNSSFFSKMTFSCLGNLEIEEKLENQRARKVYLAGLETHICVMQTAIDLINLGYKVYVLADAVGARRQIDHEIGLKRLEQEGIVLTTTESILFEWCVTSDRPEFKEISRLVKETKKDENQKRSANK